MIGQRGGIARSDLSAWAFTAQAQRLFPQTRWQPALLAEFNFASGDRDPEDGTVNTFSL